MEVTMAPRLRTKSITPAVEEKPAPPLKAVEPLEDINEEPTEEVDDGTERLLSLIKLELGVQLDANALAMCLDVASFVKEAKRLPTIEEEEPDDLVDDLLDEEVDDVDDD